MRSGVFLAAMIPAMRATPSTSPFVARFERIKDSVDALEKTILQVAVAVREVTDLLVIETMCACPEDVRCVRVGAGDASLAGEHGGVG